MKNILLAIIVLNISGCAWMGPSRDEYRSLDEVPKVAPKSPTTFEKIDAELIEDSMKAKDQRKNLEEAVKNRAESTTPIDN